MEPAARSCPIARLAVWAPVVFLLHVAEEGPRFVPWVNRLVEPDLTPSLFVAVNATAFALTAALAGAAALSRRRAPALSLLVWLAFLMAANAPFHLVASAVTGTYCPGSITAALLYLPYFAIYAAALVRRCAVPPATAVLATLLGGLPMLIHGYFIVFRGSRLF